MATTVVGDMMPSIFLGLFVSVVQEHLLCVSFAQMLLTVSFFSFVKVSSLP
jgi:hypothetical protein